MSTHFWRSAAGSSVTVTGVYSDLVGNVGKAQETVFARARDNGLAALGQWEGGGA